MIYQHISEFLQDFPDYIPVFEQSFRVQCATAPVSEMLSCNLTHETIHASIQIAMTTTAQAMFHAAETSPDTSVALTAAAHQLSSPLLSTMIQTLHRVLQNRAAPVPVQKKAREDASACNAKPPVVAPTRHNSVPPTPEPPREDPLQIRSSILASFNDIPVVYPSCPKLECSAEKCEICRTAFKRLNLSRCSGHTPCHPTGWYAHLSPALIYGLNKVHRGGEPLRLAFRAPVKGEIASPWERPLDWSDEGYRPVTPSVPPPSQAPSRGRGRGHSRGAGPSRTHATDPPPRRSSRTRTNKRLRPNPPDVAMRNLRLGSPDS